MPRDFERIAIVTRGVPAMRLIQAVRELNCVRQAAKQPPLRTIALFTDTDQHSLFVREADEVIGLGPAITIDPRDGQRKSAYLDRSRLAQALRAARADAVWVGWGFAAQAAQIADLCAELDVVFVGPPADVMRQLGDPIASKQLAEDAGLPVPPWSAGAVDTVADAREHARRLGFPLAIKACVDGHELRHVTSMSELEASFESARNDAPEKLGSATVYLEHMIAGARHVEVHIIADDHGGVCAVGVCDGTVQRGSQRLLVETPSPALTAEEDRWLRAAAARICRAAGFRNAGSVEFLFDPRTRSFAFRQVHPQLQVEHALTEVSTGLDIVKLQLQVAAGARLADQCMPGVRYQDGDTLPPIAESVPASGHAIAVRLSAEDPARDFRLTPGVIELLRLPSGPGLRVDAGVREGDTVPSELDSMLATIVAHGRDRAEALARLRRGLADTVAVIRDGTTNKALLMELLERPEVAGAANGSAWVDALVDAYAQGARGYAEIALLQAAIDAHDAELALEQTQFLSAAAHGRPRVRSNRGHAVALRYQRQAYHFRVFQLGPHAYRIHVGAARADVRVERRGRFESALTYAGQRYRTLSVAQGSELLVEIEGVPHRVARDDRGIVRAPSPAVVLAVPAGVGDLVVTGAPLVILEAMKMEMPVCAPCNGRIRHVMVRPNFQVDNGTPLVEIEIADPHADAAPTGDRVTFNPAPVSAEAFDASGACRGNLDALRRLLLGFDVDPADTQRLLAERRALCARLPVDDDQLRRGEDELLSIFTDLCSLFRRPPALDDPEGSEVLRSEEYLFTYLRAPDTQGEGLPAAFLDKVRRALLHYGVASLERSADLDKSLLRIFKAQQHPDQQAAVVLHILERRLEQIEALLPAHGPEFRSLLDRLIAVSHLRAQAVSDIAREVRYRYFDQALFERARNQVYEEMARHLHQLAERPQQSERAARMAALVSCPQPLVTVLSGQFAGTDETLREIMLEVLTRRYYRIRALTALRCRRLEGGSCVTAEYEHHGKRVQVIATHARWGDLAAAVHSLLPLLRDMPADHDIVMDLYAWSADPLSDPEATQGEIAALLDAAGFPRPLRRVVVVAGGAGESRGISGVQHFTFRASPSGYVEETLYRGLHPMMGKRVDLWRLQNFDIQRLPSPEDVYLFHAVGRTNAQDERLVAIAEVRDLTPVRDAGGRIVQLPYLERMLMEAAAGLRRFQASRPARDRLAWNRILLYVWPPLELQPDELHDLVYRLAPVTEGLGIEQVMVRAPMRDPSTGRLKDTVLRVSNPTGSGILITSGPPPSEPLEPLSAYAQKVLRMRQRGLPYPYEIIRLLTPPRGVAAEFPPGQFIEYDLTERGRLVPVQRAPGGNTANIVVGLIRNDTEKYPSGMTRVVLLGDPSKAMGALAEPECWRICAALDLAEEMRVPLEWFSISAGAKISMESGTENMDWIARVLRRIIEFTQAGGEINVVVTGINVGAQPYWNSEATMLLHTRGILIMTADGAMVLTGKQALDYSGSVSAEDNQGIGGYERIMGPNGQAQYRARDISAAAHILFRHYAHTYVVPGERFPRPALTADPRDRDVRRFPHAAATAADFECVGDIFSNERNPARKRPFDIRTVMRAVSDQDHLPLERWADMHGAETAVVMDVHLGGHPVCLLGIESHSIARRGFLPADGPDHWTAGTLFPKSSKKIAHTINAVSDNRPLVVLANLSGFDGSPESMRELQLEYGAEIGRAVVNFRGPIVFCVISRYHGGAYVVFSGTLNQHVEVAAVEGSYASVIGGSPAAAVVFTGEVAARTRKDPRVQAVERQLASADGAEKARLRQELEVVSKQVQSEMLGQVAEEFDTIHSIERALAMGSLDHIIPAHRLRPYLIEAVERGMRRCLDPDDEAQRFPWPQRAPIGAVVADPSAQVPPIER